MPRKIRDLIKDLRDAGVELQKGRGKSDHQVWRHPIVNHARIVIDGKPSNDAKPYQEDNFKEAIELIRRAGDESPCSDRRH